MFKKAFFSVILTAAILFGSATYGSAQVWIEDVGTSIFPSRFMPSEGSVGALVIPVEFVDFQFQEDPVDTLKAMFDGDGTDLAPSVADYFYAASYGEMQMLPEIQPVVRLSDTRKSYNGDHAKLIQDLLAVLVDRGVDLHDFDQNADGVLDGLYIVWAGAPTSAGSDWWPYSDTFYFDFETSGILIGSFSSLSYELLTEDSALRQYTAIHETGHQLGLTDYYASSYVSGTGASVMMDRNEGDEDCFSKTLLGWTVPQIITDSCYVSLQSASVTNDAALIAPLSWDGNYLSEYFMAEYVTPEANQSNQPLPDGGGVRIWHVNAATSQWTDDITASMYRCDNSGDGPKLLSIVNAVQEWYGTADVISEDLTMLYTGENSGISIRVDSIENGKAVLCISYFGEEPARPEMPEESAPEEDNQETEESQMDENSSARDEDQELSEDNTEGETNADAKKESEEDSSIEDHEKEETKISKKLSDVLPVVFLIVLCMLVYLLLKGDKKRKHKRGRKRRK